jgi:hypothetical protein
MAAFKISKFTVNHSTVSVPTTANRAQLVELLNKRIREMENYTEILKMERIIVQRHV